MAQSSLKFPPQISDISENSTFVAIQAFIWKSPNLFSIGPAMSYMKNRIWSDNNRDHVRSFHISGNMEWIYDRKIFDCFAEIILPSGLVFGNMSNSESNKPHKTISGVFFQTTNFQPTNDDFFGKK